MRTSHFLPTEIYGHIYRFFTPKELHNVALTCRSGKRLADQILLEQRVQALGIEQKDFNWLMTSKNVNAEASLSLINHYKHVMDMAGNNYHTLLKNKRITITEMDNQLVTFYEKTKKAGFQVLYLDGDMRISVGTSPHSFPVMLNSKSGEERIISGCSWEDIDDEDKLMAYLKSNAFAFLLVDGDNYGSTQMLH